MNQIKTYKSFSEIAINISLKNGNKHIAFIPSSDGTSIYMTGDPEEQAAIEKHHNFNKLFREKACKPEPKKPEVKPNEGGDSASENGVKIIKMPDVAAAKDYLVDKFGISRTALRTQSSIIEQAKQHNIEIENI